MVKTSTSFALAALVGYAAAECPNACSGHGTCGAKDSCSCYQNYQGNDCSERTCYFGLAHVDSPKGDLNADGLISGPLTTVITGSEVYPWGTTEQFPNANANEGHFYMECSNKGICDRKTGTCDCFDGYTGTACARAACPNDCSGHGTCESIKELAEMRSFDTTAHDAPTTRVAGGATGSHDYSAAIEESYSYDLWDSDKTMGCKCDPVYYGADCSLKKCKYGVDPLFYDNTDGAIHQTTVVHLGSTGGCKASTCVPDATPTPPAGEILPVNLAGTFKLVFYDVFGEKYVTKDLSAAGSGAAALTAAQVQRALEALPNGVIAEDNTDVTGTPPAAVTVAMQALAGVGIATAGGFGGGSTGATGGVGLGTSGAATTADGVMTGPEFTITFKTNPGILKAVEVDTSAILNAGVADYWVANARQGQFSSRYTTNLGRVNTLTYGSKTLFTNSDLQSSVVGATASASLVKVGGQEFRVHAEAATHLTLSEPYLGASITATLTDTGASIGGAAGDVYVTATAACPTCVTAVNVAANTLTVDVDMTGAGVADPITGSYIKITASVGGAVCIGRVSVIATSLITLEPGHGCAALSSGTAKIETAAGQFTTLAAGFVVAATPSKSAEISVLGVNTAIKANALVAGTGLSVGGCAFNAVKFGTAPGADIASGGRIVGGANFDCANLGTTLAPSMFGEFFYAQAAAANLPVYRRTDNPNNQNIYKAPTDTGDVLVSNLMLTRGNSAAYLVNPTTEGTVEQILYTTANGEKFTTAANLVAGIAQDDVFFVNGKGPMVAKAAAAAKDLTIKDPSTAMGKFFPHSMATNALVTFPVYKAIASNTDGNLAAGSVLLLDGRRYRVKTRGGAAVAGVDGMSKVTLSENYAGGSIEQVCAACIATTTQATAPKIVTDGTDLIGKIAAGDQVMIQGYTHGDFLTTINSIDATGTDLGASLGGGVGTGTFVKSGADLASGTLALYKTRYGAAGAVTATRITEVAANGANTPYQYVAQCSNRGTCDAATGLCKCFKGYANDNCDKQNMLAM